MPERHNRNLVDVLRLTQSMLELAERGDEERQDSGCGVLYGALRDAAFKIRRFAVAERDTHITLGDWDDMEMRMVQVESESTGGSQFF